MTGTTIDNVKWSLEEEGLIGVLDGLRSERLKGRAYEVRNYGKGKIFIKYFREEGLDGFLRNRISPRGKKEYLFGKKLLSLQIPTAVPLGYGVEKRGSYVIQQWIEGESLLAAVQRREDRENYLGLLAALLRDLAAKGVRHNDLHLENILVSGQVLYLIDLHKAQVKARFSREDELSNLCHALSMVYGDMREEERRTFYSAYGSEDLRPEVEAGLDRLWKRWIERKGQRAFRKTSKISAGKGILSIRGREEKGKGEFVEVIKRDSKVTVERYTDHVRKVYRDRGRLEQAWKNHVILEYLNLSLTPQPYYMRMPSGRTRGFIAMEDLKGKGKEMDRFLDEVYDGMDNVSRRRLIKKSGDFLGTTLNNGILHRDLKGCNLFVVHNDLPLLLDIEDIRFSRPDHAFLKKMFIQLNTSLPARIRTRDRMRFFSYVMRRLTINRKELLREVIRESLTQEIVYEGASGLKREAW